MDARSYWLKLEGRDEISALAWPLRPISSTTEFSRETRVYDDAHGEPVQQRNRFACWAERAFFFCDSRAQYRLAVSIAKHEKSPRDREIMSSFVRSDCCD